MEKMVGKIIILRDICDAKDTLFGPFSSDRTLQMKSKLWIDILEKAKSLGLVAACKDYRYMRDIYWQNMKRHSLSKRENEHIHGKQFKRTPIDDLVYEIIDNTSSLHQQKSLKPHQKPLLASAKPTLRHSVMLKTDQLDFELINEDEHEEMANNTIDETAEVTIEKVDHFEDENQAEYEAPMEDELNNEDVVESIEPSGSNGRNYEYRKSKQKIAEGILKKRKFQLEIDYLELQNYKTKLEVLSLENKLGIRPSKFTKGIAKRRKKKMAAETEKQHDSSDFNSD